jgi:hypothetical protein
MTLIKSTFLGAAILVGVTAAADAQWQYPGYGSTPGNYGSNPSQYASNPYEGYQPYPYNPAPATPPSWSYSPYTNGMSACLSWESGDSSCRDTERPTSGQPSYRLR